MLHAAGNPPSWQLFLSERGRRGRDRRERREAEVIHAYHVCYPIFSNLGFPFGILDHFRIVGSSTPLGSYNMYTRLIIVQEIFIFTLIVMGLKYLDPKNNSL